MRSSMIFFVKTSLALALITLLANCSAPKTIQYAEIKVLHFNIFELNSGKIKSGNKQIKAVKSTLEGVDFDLFSVNEIQYDLPRVPTPAFETTGENLTRLLHLLRPNTRWKVSFYPANTGSLARQKSNLHYVDSSHPKARSFADPYNYGLFPAQYSTGLASRFPIVSRKVIGKLAWKKFNPTVKLKSYKTAKGKRLPENIELFDKNFVDTVVNIQGRDVHVITLHTVPAYHFGNRFTPNYQRNADQLAFLEWYLDSSSPLRKTAITKELEKMQIRPLNKSDHFIAMGDWNTDIFAQNPGSVVLRRLYQSLGQSPPKLITHESKGFGAKPFQVQLDYILHSPTFVSKRVSVLNDRPKQLSTKCVISKNIKSEKPMTRVTLKGNSNCQIEVPKKYAQQKRASDHFALYSVLSFRNRP